MGIIKPFKNKDGKTLYPITRGEAVFVDDNKTLPTKLTEIETSITDLDTGLTNEFNNINVDENRLTQAKDITGSINELFQSVSNGKKSVASAITDKGVTTSETDTMPVMLDNLKKVISVGQFTTSDYDITVDNKGKEVICTVGKKTKKTFITGEGGVLNDTTGKYEIKIKSNNGRSSGSDIYSEDIKTISMPQPLVKGGSVKDNGDETYTYYKPASGSSGDEGKFIRQSEISDYNFINSGGTFSHKRRNFGYVVEGNILYTINGEKYENDVWKSFEGIEAYTIDNNTNPILFTKSIADIKYNHSESRYCCSPFYYRDKIIIPVKSNSVSKKIAVQIIDLTTFTLTTYTSNTELYDFTTAFNDDKGKLYFIGGINGSGLFNDSIYFYINIDSLLHDKTISVSATSLDRKLPYTITNFKQSQAIYCNGIIFMLDCERPTADGEDYVNHLLLDIYNGKSTTVRTYLNTDNAWVNSSAILFNHKIYLFWGNRYSDKTSSSPKRTICRVFDTDTMKFCQKTYTLEPSTTPVFYDNRLYQFQDFGVYYASHSLITEKTTLKNDIDYIDVEVDCTHFLSCKYRNLIYFFYDNGNDIKKYIVYNVNDKSFSIYNQPSTPFLMVTYCRMTDSFIGITATDIYKATHTNGIELKWEKTFTLPDTLTNIYRNNFIEFNGFIYLFESLTNNKIYKINCNTCKIEETYADFSNARKIFKVYKGRVVSYERESNADGIFIYREYIYDIHMKNRTAGRIIKLNDDIVEYTFYNNWLFAKCDLFVSHDTGYKLIDTEFGSDELIDVRNLDCTTDIKIHSNYNLEVIDNIIYIIAGSASGHCSINYFAFPTVNEPIDWGTNGGNHHPVNLRYNVFLLGSDSKDATISRQQYKSYIINNVRTNISNIPDKCATWGFTPVSIPLNDKIYVIGGIDNNNKVYDTMFEVAENGVIKFNEAYKMPVPLYGYSATEYNSRIYITGGRTAYNDDTMIFNKTLIYYPTDNTWTYGGDLPEKCPDVKIFTYKNNLYALNIGKDFKAWKYSFDSNTWDVWDIEFPSLNINESSIMDKFSGVKNLSMNKFILMNTRYTFIIDMVLNRIYLSDTGYIYSQVLDTRTDSDYIDFGIYNGYLYLFNIDGKNNISKRYKLIGEEHHYFNYYIYTADVAKAVNMGNRIFLFYENNNSCNAYDLVNNTFRDVIFYYSSNDDVYNGYSPNDSFLNNKNALFILKEKSLYRISDTYAFRSQTLFSDTNKKHLMNGYKTDSNFYAVDFGLKKIYEISGTVPNATIVSTNSLSFTENITNDFDSVCIDDSLYLYSAKKPIYRFYNKSITNTNIICPENIKNSFTYKSGFVLFPSAPRSNHYYYFNILNNTLTTLYLNDYHSNSIITFDKNKAYYFGNTVNKTHFLEYEYLDNSMISLNSDVGVLSGAISVRNKTGDLYLFSVDTPSRNAYTLLFYDARIEKWKRVGYYESDFNTCFTAINMFIDDDDSSIYIQTTGISSYDIFIKKINLTNNSVTSKKVNIVTLPKLVYTTWYKKFLYYIYDGKLYKSDMTNTTTMSITNLPTTSGISFIPVIQKDNVLLVYVLIDGKGQGIGKIDLSNNTYSELFIDPNNMIINRLRENRPVVIDDKLYFFGGKCSKDADTDDVIIYDITNNKFLHGNSVGFLRPYNQLICAKDDFIYIVSGRCSSGYAYNNYSKSFIKIKKSVFNTLIEPVTEIIDGNINLKSFNHKTIFNVDSSNPNISYRTTTEVEI